MFWIDKYGQVYDYPPWKQQSTNIKRKKTRNIKRTLTKCPTCEQKLKLPVLPGKTIEVRCPSCCNSFIFQYQHKNKKSWAKAAFILLIFSAGIIALGVFLRNDLPLESESKPVTVESHVPLELPGHVRKQYQPSEKSPQSAPAKTLAKEQADYVIPFSIGYEKIVSDAWSENRYVLKLENVIVVEDVVISGLYKESSIDMLLDTGATNSVITRRVAEKTGAFSIHGKTQESELADGSKVEFPITKRNVRIGNIEVDLELRVLPEYSDRGFENSASKNLLGIDFFSGFEYQIDTKEKHILLWEK